MSDETTVLLVKGAPLPDGLQAQLEAKGVFVEEAEPSHLEASLMAVAPDLVLVFGVEPLDAVVATLAAETSTVPIVVVADRSLHRDLRQKYKTALGTIVPTDLPHSALSHRIATMSRRASKGEALVQTMSLAPPKAAASATRGGPAADVAVRIVDTSTPTGPMAGPAASVTAPTASGVTLGAAAAKAALAPAAKAATGAVASTKAAATPAAGGPTPDKAGPDKVGPDKVGLAQSVKAAASAAALATKGKPFARAAASPKEGLASGLAAPEPAKPKQAAKVSTAFAPPAAAPPAAARPAQSSAQTKPAALPAEPHTPAAPALRDVAASMWGTPGPSAPEPPKSSTRGLPAEFEDEFPTAAFELPFEMRHKARRDSLPPETVRQSAPDGKIARLADQEALVAQEIEARQRLSSGGDDPVATPSSEDQRRAAEADRRARSHRRSHATASAVRLVLCDDDLTRADALASEMREHGLDVMLLSPEHSQVRWPRLRRFAPHGLLVDERSLSKGGRQIVSAFRRDPFLKYVPLVVVPFQRIYRESEARANLAPVFPLLSPLGHEELSLLEQLASKGEIVVELSQVLPSRLVEVLGENDTTCVLSTNGRERRLTWPIAAGCAGKAELSLGTGSPGSTLTAEDALRFLLEQDEAQVVVALRPQIHLTLAEPIGALLDRVTASIDPPLQYSIAPGKSAETPVRNHGVKATLLGVAPPAQAAVDPGPGALPTIPAPALVASAAHAAAAVGAADAPGPERRRPALAALGEKARVWVQPYVALALEKKRTWPPALFWTLALAPVLLLIILLGIGLWSSGEDADLPAILPGAGAAPEPGGSAQQAPAAPVAPRFDRFRVADDQPAPTCEEILGQAQPAASSWDAATFWKAARQALMQGNVERAHEMMCRAVAKDPASPAAEGLAAFYLGRRALAPADRYLQGVLAVDAERRPALELQSDVRNQQGQVDDALRILLRTVRLEPGDAVRRAVVSRKFSADAELAIKSGDLPMAERLLRRAVVLSPTNDQATVRLAEVFLRVGLRDAAKLWAHLLLAGPSKHAEAQMILGDAARLDGDTATARSHYEKVSPESGQFARAQTQLKALP